MARRRRSYGRPRTRTRTRYIRAPRRFYGRIRRAGRRGRGLIGKINVKNIAVGSGLLMVMQRFQPFGGNYKPAVDKVAVGMVGQVTRMGQSDMLTVGIKEGLATLGNQYLGGGAISPMGGASL